MKIAIIRREFIRYAINSVLKSKIPKDEYEFIVVENFHDDYVDKIVNTIMENQFSQTTHQ